MTELLTSPVAATTAALVVTLGWVAYLAARTILRVSEGESLHSDWPEDLTQVIVDDYGRHAAHPGRPTGWFAVVSRIEGYVGRHRAPHVDASDWLRATGRAGRP